jgi:proteasome lid subunit RPN8/RPN11
MAAHSGKYRGDRDFLEYRVFYLGAERMFDRVHVNRRAEQGFRRRARKAFPVEYIETLWGRIRGGALYVHIFMPLHHGSVGWKNDIPANLWYDPEDLEDQEDEAREHKLDYLGTIHSHVHQVDSIFSEADLRSIQGTVDCVMGICSITLQCSNGRTRKVCQVDYWPSPRPMQVVYGTQKRRKKR